MTSTRWRIGSLYSTRSKSVSILVMTSILVTRQHVKQPKIASRDRFVTPHSSLTISTMNGDRNADVINLSLLIPTAYKPIWSLSKLIAVLGRIYG